jgi:hypothetical protein
MFILTVKAGNKYTVLRKEDEIAAFEAELAAELGE